MTDYQKAQLLHVHLTGGFKYRNNQGNKVTRSAWVKMLDALIGNSYINKHCQVTDKGREYLDKNHWNISLDALN